MAQVEKLITLFKTTSKKQLHQNLVVFNFTIGASGSKTDSIDDGTYNVAREKEARLRRLAIHDYQGTTM